MGGVKQAQIEAEEHDPECCVACDEELTAEEIRTGREECFDCYAEAQG